MTQHLTLAALALCLTTTSASSTLAQSNGPATPSEAGTSWQLMGSPSGQGIGDAWITIAPDGGITGNSGCNSFSASGSINSGSFKVTSPIGATGRLCPEPGLMDQEAALLSALERAATYDFSLRTGTLWIMDENDETLLEFKLRQ